MNKEKLLINDLKSNNSEDMRNKQVEEMARKMCRNYQPNGNCASDDDPCGLECIYGYCAERIYGAGYRKQSEGINSFLTLSCRSATLS